MTRMTTKGQVVIPKQYRDQSDLHVGDSIRLTVQREGIRIARRSGWARATAGCLAASVAQMEPDMMDELAERVAIQEAREKYEGFE